MSTVAAESCNRFASLREVILLQGNGKTLTGSAEMAAAILEKWERQDWIGLCSALDEVIVKCEPTAPRDPSEHERLEMLFDVVIGMKEYVYSPEQRSAARSARIHALLHLLRHLSFSNVRSHRSPSRALRG